MHLTAKKRPPPVGDHREGLEQELADGNCEFLTQPLAPPHSASTSRDA
jgi:hypothetical protein